MTTPILEIPEIPTGVVNAYLVANAAIRALESAFTGSKDIDLGSSNQTISDGDFFKFYAFNAINNAVSRTMTVPQTLRVFSVINSGSADLSVARGSTIITVVVGEFAIFYADGSTNGLKKSAGGGSGSASLQNISVACSDETTALTAGIKTTFRMPYGFTLAQVRASLTTAQASGSTLTVDIKQGGSSILSTLITIDNTEKTSTTAATPAVISVSPLTDDAEVTVEITQVGDGSAEGLKVYLIGYSI